MQQQLLMQHCWAAVAALLILIVCSGSSVVFAQQQQRQQQQTVLPTSSVTAATTIATVTTKTLKAAAAATSLTTAANATTTINGNTTTTTTLSAIEALAASTTAATTKTRRAKVLNTSSEILSNFESSEEVVQSSAELLSDSDDAGPVSRITPTTYRPPRPSVAPLSSAQDRERKLMNVLAARRSALKRGGFRTRVGTTGRTAAAAGTSIENTSKSPSDPRSICIRNCTKNFTRRTTASCMRQCANFQRVSSSSSISSNNNGTVVVVKAASKNGLNNPSGIDRDLNEILFTDESSHGLFVVAKDLNDTLNHIPETGFKSQLGGAAGVVAKFRARGKTVPLSSVTIATTSIEDDDIAPYLYFGQKLPPIRPAQLTITSLSEEHPKLLEVSVAETTMPTLSSSSTTSTSTASTTLLSTTERKLAPSTTTLSAVERSRSRYKYNMRDRANGSFNRRFAAGIVARPTVAAAALLGDNSNEVKTLPLTTSTPSMPKETVNDTLSSKSAQVLMQPVVELPQLATRFGSPLHVEPPTSTPLLISVLSDEEEATEHPGTTTTSTTTTTTTTSSTTTTTMPRPTTTTTLRPTTTTTLRPTTTTTLRPSTTTTSRPSTTTILISTSPIIPFSTIRQFTSTFISTLMTTIPEPSTTSKILTRTTTTTTSTTSSPQLPSTLPTTTSTTASPPRTKSIIEEDTERLRALGPSLTQQINTDEKTNLIIFVNHTSGVYRPPMRNEPDTGPSYTTESMSGTRSSSTLFPQQNNHYPVIESSSTTTTSSSDISSTIVTDEREVSLEMRRLNVATYVLAGIGIFPLIAVIVYIMRQVIMKRRAKDDEVFDVCIADQQPISPVKKLDSKYHVDDDDDEDEVDNSQQPHQNHNHHQQQKQHHHQPQQFSKHQQQYLKQQQRDNNFNNINNIINNKNNLLNSSNNNNNNNNNNRYDESCSVTSDQEFDRSNIRLKSLLGEGNFGQVWKAEADDLSGHFGATRIVAVKTVRAGGAQLGLKDEANIMRKLGSHQNVVTLLGACVESEPHMLIMEYAMRGRLLSLLRAARSATNILPASVPGGRSLAPLSPRTLAGFALDISCGMEYIAERRIVHRDLAARNVLLDHNGVCKICDFGMSIDLDAERALKSKLIQQRNKDEETAKNCANQIMRSNSNKFKFDFGGRFILNHWSNNFGGGNNHNGQSKDCHEKKSHSPDTISRRPALPIRWMAPEALQYHVFTTDTDVWAFGIVLWEIATLGSTPYSHLSGREVIRNVPSGLRPDLPKEGRHEFYNLMARCWHKEPHMRPSFTQARLEISRSLGKWVEDDSAASDYMDVSGFSEDLEHGMVYFNHRISEFECEI